MTFSRIRWRIALPYVLLITVVMAGLAWYLSGVVRQTYLDDLQTKLASQAQMIADDLREPLALGVGKPFYTEPVAHYSRVIGARVTVIALDGAVLADSEEDPATMDSHLYRPEVQQAFRSNQGSSIRYSRSVEYDMMYVAVTVLDGDRIVGVIRVALPLKQIETDVRRLRNTVLSATGLTALLAWLLSVWAAERIVRPVRWLTQAAERLARGDFQARLLPTTRDEIGSLTRAFNEMAIRLEDTIATLDRERARLAGVLEHMANGVLITDEDGRVGLINPAACRFFGLQPSQALGSSFAQVVRDHQLIELWRECVERREERVGLVEVGHRGPLLQAVLTPLAGAGEQACLAVLQDLTRTRHLETIRRDFISNISHELRTPLASLKALCETLRDSALEDPPAARRFLDRIETEVDSMTQMVRELLELARIESGRVPIRLMPLSLAAAVAPAVERLLPQAERGGLALTANLPDDLPPVLGDAERLQQVVTNLLHNAIKFTPAGGSVTLSAEAVGEEVIVAVRDTGVGIPEEALSRIFERFYKADRARSSEGTGLGLAIAKHVVQAHSGRIWAESTEGRGSTFYFSLPIALGERNGS